jgi:hypothetical protein
MFCWTPFTDVANTDCDPEIHIGVATHRAAGRVCPIGTFNSLPSHQALHPGARDSVGLGVVRNPVTVYVGNFAIGVVVAEEVI